MSQLHLHRRRDRGPVWQAQVYMGGKRYRFTCHTTDKRTARRYAEQRVRELEERHNRGLVGLPEPVRVSEVLSRYERQELPKLRASSRRRAAGIVREARSWFASAPLRDPDVSRVRPDDIQAYLESNPQERVSPRTVNLHRAILHRIFRLCVTPWLLIPNNPVAATERLREEAREPRLLSDDEYRQLHRACAGQATLVLFVTLAWETGGRSGELLQLEWDDIDFERALVTFRNDPRTGRQTKGRRSRTVPLSENAVRALREHAAAFRLLAPLSPYVFKHLTPNRTKRPGDRLESLYRAFKRAAKAAGVPDVRPHDLRHCFVTRKLAEGVAVQLVSRYVGHTDLATTMRYAHLVPEHLRAVVASERSQIAKMTRS